MKKIVFGMMIISSFSISAAEPVYESPKKNSMFYYRIGGGKPFTALPRLNITTINLSLGVGLTGLFCGKLDPKVTVKNALNRAKDGLDDMMVQLQNAATAAIANLPGYILMKYNPDLYETLMSSVAKANFKFSLATKSCEQMATEIAADKDPYDSFAQISVSDKWKIGVGTGGVDAVDLKESSASAEDGFLWVGGVRAGGSNQEKAKPTQDAAAAGYNMLLGRNVTDKSDVSPTLGDQPIVKSFSSPENISKWVENVLGDDEICVNKGCNSNSKPGVGLWVVLQEKMDLIWPQIEGLVSGAISPTPTNLKNASAPGNLITLHLLRSLQALDGGDAGVLAGRLLNEIALALTVDEALLVKRALNAGYREANIVKNKSATKLIKQRLTQLDLEMNNLMGEMRLRNEIVSNTAKEIILMEKSFRDHAKNRIEEQSGDGVDIYHGVKEDNGG